MSGGEISHKVVREAPVGHWNTKSTTPSGFVTQGLTVSRKPGRGLLVDVTMPDGRVDQVEVAEDLVSAFGRMVTKAIAWGDEQTAEEQAVGEQP